MTNAPYVGTIGSTQNDLDFVHLSKKINKFNMLSNKRTKKLLKNKIRIIYITLSL
jgi:hypothetical protein